MNNFSKLVAIANKLDSRGFTKEADELDSLIQKLAQSWPHDDEDVKLDDEIGAWLEADEKTEGEEYMPMFGEGGPSEAEINAMEQGIDIFEGEDLAHLERQLESLNEEMQLFTEVLASGKMTPEDFDLFERIKEDFSNFTKRIEEAEADKSDLEFEA